MGQLPVNFNFSLQHLQTRSPELFELDDFDGVALVSALDLNSLVDLAAVALAQLVIDGVLVDAHLDL